MEYKGIVHEVRNGVSKNPQYKNGLVVLTVEFGEYGEFTKKIPFEFFGSADRPLASETVKQGDYVEIKFTCEGSYYEPTDRWFPKIKGVKVTKLGGVSQTPAPVEPPKAKAQTQTAPEPPAPKEEIEGDDLPF